MKKVVSVILVFAMCSVLCVPVFAQTDQTVSFDEIQLYSSGVEPKTPNGYTYWYSRNGNASIDATISSVGLTIALSAASGLPGLLASIVITGITSLFDESEIKGKYVDYIYTCDDPISQGVPYIYWHKIRYTVELDADGDGKKETYVQWSDGYEYATMCELPPVTK